MDSNFDSATTTPDITGPSSPQRFNSLFYTAPTSPAHFSFSYNAGDTARGRSGRSLSSIPFNWEEKPGISKTNISTATSSNYGDAEENLDEIDFAFDFSCQSEQGSVSADELFDGGKIKPLKPPPRFKYDLNKSVDSPKSPRSPKKFIKEVFSPRQKRNEFDPFAVAVERTRTETVQENANETKETEKGNSRGNHQKLELLYDPALNQEEPTKNSSPFRSVWYKKWRIKELSLFGVKENRVTAKSHVQKHPLFEKTPKDHVSKSASFRSIDGDSETPSSDHELHYTASKRDTEEMKKLAFLPYKQRLLGCLKYRKDLL